MALSPDQICGVLLAAGYSTRFGSNKLLHRLPDGRPIALAAAQNMLAVLPNTVAVVHSGQGRVARLLREAGCRVVSSRNAKSGMGASLASAVRATRAARGWVVGLADMPFIRPASIRSIVACLNRGAVIAAPSLGGVRGHPVGISARFRDELLRLKGDHGARALIQANKGSITLVPTDDAGVLRDIDTPGDAAQLSFSARAAVSGSARAALKSATFRSTEKTR